MSKRKKSASKKPSGNPSEKDSTSSSTTPSHESEDPVMAMSPIGNSNGSELPPLSRILSVVMLILGIGVVGALFLKVMAGFFVPLFLAALLVVIFRPLHQWFLRKSRDRPRVAALLTTGMILMMVLVPVVAMISVATSQFTTILSHVKNFEDLSGTLDRVRSKLGISLAYPQQFRRLDELADSLDETLDSETGESTLEEKKRTMVKIDEAMDLTAFLHEKVEGSPYADANADKAIEELNEYRCLVESHRSDENDDLVSKMDVKDQMDRQSVVAAASIRTWMRSKLGGTFRSQLCLIANPSSEDFRQWLFKGKEVLQPRFVSFTSSTGEYVWKITIGFVILIVAVYFFLVDGAGMIRTLMRLSPLDDAYEERLLLEFDRTSRAVVLATMLSAIAQGALAAAAFWFFGFESIILLFLITSLMALVPFIGAAVIWVPAAIYLAVVEQRYVPATVLMVYGATAISMVDNLIKPMVLQGKTTLHPLFALLSVIGGMSVFGPVGLIVGPMVVVFLQTLLEILSHELAERDREASDTSAKSVLSS